MHWDIVLGESGGDLPLFLYKIVRFNMQGKNKTGTEVAMQCGSLTSVVQRIGFNFWPIIEDFVNEINKK